MIKNHVSVALRSMVRHMGYSALNLMGLAVGLGVVFLITLFVADERSFDAYHRDSEQIYRLVAGQPDSEFEGIAKINGPWGITAAAQIPEIESLTRFVFFGQEVFETEGVRTQVSGGFYADSTTFEVFSWRLLQGDAAEVLIEPGSMILTASLAEALFPGMDALDRTIRVAGSRDFRVTGILEDVPSNSHFRFQFLVSMASNQNEMHDDWVRWNQYYTYFRLRPGADPSHIGPAVEALLANHLSEDRLNQARPVRAQPLRDIYLRSDMFREIAPMGDERTVRILGLIALFILFLAAVNFVNLSTARASIRAREVGVRKSLGATRGTLMWQFMTETLLSVLAASVLAGALSVVALPAFNGLAGKAFEADALLRGEVLLVMSGVTVVLALLAGAYPAVFLSGFRPAAILRGAIFRGGGLSMRRGLVVLQFVVSVALIMSTGIVSDQLTFLREKPLGFDREGLLTVPIQDPSLAPRLDQLRADFLTVPGVTEASLSANAPGGGDWGIPIEIPGMTREELPPVRMMLGDHFFARTYGFRMIEGRDFDTSRATDAENAVLVNQEFARRLGWEAPIGQRILIPGIERELEVVGVVEDFHYRSARESILPLLVFIAPPSWRTMVTLRIGSGQGEAVRAGLASVYARYDALNPFTFSFVDEQFQGMYRSEDRVGRLLSVATFLALFVACLGLFGLAAHTAERRTREIGVRKTLGASETAIVMLLSKETAILVGLAIVLATPFAYLAGREWLDGFAYRMDVRPTTLLLAGLAAVVVALLTTGLHAWRAARMDPSRALRVE